MSVRDAASSETRITLMLYARVAYLLSYVSIITIMLFILMSDEAVTWWNIFRVALCWSAIMLLFLRPFKNRYFYILVAIINALITLSFIYGK